MSLSLFSFTTMKQTWHGEARRRQSATLISFYLQRSMQAFNCYNELYVHLCPLTIMCAAGPVGHFPPPVCTGGLVSLCTDIHPHSADRPDRFLTQFEKTAFAKRAPPNSASPLRSRSQVATDCFRLMATLPCRATVGQTSQNPLLLYREGLIFWV